MPLIWKAVASAAEGPEHMPFGTSKGPTFLGSFSRVDVGGAHDGARRGAARAHDDAGALVDDVARLEPGVADRLVHGDVVPADAGLHEAARLARDHGLPLEIDGAVHLAAEARARRISRRARCRTWPPAARRALPGCCFRSRKRSPCRSRPRVSSKSLSPHRRAPCAWSAVVARLQCCRRPLRPRRAALPPRTGRRADRWPRR